MTAEDGARAAERQPGADPAQTRDVHYGYDLRDLQTYARFDSLTGEGVTNAYDGFGRLISSTDQYGRHDPHAGLPVRPQRQPGAGITHPDGDLTSPTTSTRRAGSTASARMARARASACRSTIGYAPDGRAGRGGAPRTARSPPTAMTASAGRTCCSTTCRRRRRRHLDLHAQPRLGPRQPDPQQRRLCLGRPLCGEPRLHDQRAQPVQRRRAARASPTTPTAT